MATANAVSVGAAADVAVLPAATEEDATVKAASKRYEGLVMVRTKAIKGKGAWYWAHLEPILLRSSDTGLPKAVKLRCSLCDAVFSASNPSRTASEHLKRGTCPSFHSPTSAASAAASPSPPPPFSSHHNHNRKRALPPPPPYQVSPLAMVDPSAPNHHLEEQQHLVLSGGKEDLGALAMLEDSVKKLKSPKASPCDALGKAQAEFAISLLADWVHESCGAVSFSSVIDHPKFRAFLQQVGLNSIPCCEELAGSRLDARYEEAHCESEARIHDAPFFQLASSGWKPRANAGGNSGMVSLSVNLPNGTSVFWKAVFNSGTVPSKYAEEIMWNTVTGICEGSAVQRCVGIVADKFKSKALWELESVNSWMVNLSCQLHGINSLIKDFARELPLFRDVAANCYKIAHFFNTNSPVRSVFQRCQLQELDRAGLLRVAPAPLSPSELWGSGRGGMVAGIREMASNFGPIFAMMEDILASAQALHLAVLDEPYKLVSMDDPVAREVADVIQDEGFWSDLEAVHSLVKLIRVITQEMEAERPLVGQCLPLWNELRSKVKEWCSKFGIDDTPVSKLIEKRFKKNYHPAWSAAFVLDPLYLIKDASGKYLPPFKCLTPEQEKDVDKLITRLVSREESHIALMELMKWRSEGLDPLYAQAVQMKQRDPVTGKMRIANPHCSRLIWETYLSEFKSLGKVALRLIFLHATSCGFNCNLSFVRWVSSHRRSRAVMDRAQKMVFIAAHAKLERRDFSSEEEKDADLFADRDDDMLNEVYVDAN